MTTTGIGQGEASGASVVVNEGRMSGFRGGHGGYARISGATTVWNEAGDPMPGQPSYDLAIPFYPPVAVATIQPILLRGGRDFIIDHIVLDAEGVVRNVTGAIFIAQLRRTRFSRYTLGQFSVEILDGPTGSIRLRLTPDQTAWVSRWTRTGVYDVEMQLGGVEYTVIPESPFRALPGISQGTMISAGTATAIGTANLGDA